jgi:hypothetical protein
MAFWCSFAHAAPVLSSFSQGITAYKATDYDTAAKLFRQSAAEHLSSGVFQNLGLTEWQRSRPGEAILAWEQSLWLDPFNSASRGNLRFARKAAQVEAPDLSWDEVISTWLPPNWWAWIAGTSLWLAVGMVTVPPFLRWRKAAWHQGVAAFGAMMFLLSLPAHLGVYTRSSLGFVIDKQVPLRLTPTSEAQAITQLGSGDPVRVIRARGHYRLVRTSRAVGWLESSEFGLICPPEESCN